MRGTLKLLFNVAVAVVLVLVVLGAARHTLSPSSWMGSFLANPFGMTTRTPSGPVVLEQVQRLQRLETCRYNGQVIVRGETKGLLPVWLAGDRLLFVGRGEAVAGIDLARLRPEDVSVQGDRITLRLPASEILHVRLDNKSSEVHERSSGLFSGADEQLETRVRISAEDQLRQAALDSKILATAQTNAQQTLTSLLRQMGFCEIRFL